ncbi:23S rRNA (uracil-5-)-methyltransferase RumA [Acetitomaculum ruminis DSM 5522]|uniref:23S rRNA (Uracil-5-)-methyltransferase RumA n=1 Tax=Acetitomaculum ruminis DSM 5522 TaxID=1120918 RepID=A0A1I1A6M3_9FIRM|nr:23S rRNA (uracil(1939)-C(5))-methyltransferase RlmD [Acetitomaculum ruminis]SFB33567.1 23S rRNA (uracil-5-)-methyltransferase RumA [Acetitomaculum ruminis DSM 5522]
MKKGDILSGEVVRIDFPNKGIIKVYDENISDYREVTVKNAIPGQTVKFQINKKKHGQLEGRLLEIIEKSSLETAVACEHYKECGGCLYQGISYENQLSIKEEQIKKILENSYKEEFDFEGIIASPVTNGYRNKMEFSFGDEYMDGPLALGLHKRNSFYDIVDITGCKICHEDFSAIIKANLEYFKSIKENYFHKMRHVGFLRHLLIRKAASTGEILVNLVTSSQSELRKEEYVKILTNLNLEGKIVGILHTINDSKADAVKCDEMEILYGKDYFFEEILGLRFKISPFSFFQTNSKGAEILYSKAREYAGNYGDGKVVFDLYSGTGTIAQIMAKVAKKVVGIEIVEEAVDAAKENADINGIDNCEFIAGDVLKELDNVTQKPDFIILDPPRDGVNPKALKKIIDFNVKNIVYISCKPTSLARDLVELRAAGYKIVKGCGVDMFPYTANTESVILLSKSETM